MKKYIFVALAAAAFASCSQDEALMLNQEEIQFGDAFVNNATRAADKTYSGDKALTAFNLYGTVTGTAGTINIYNGCEVTGTVGSTIVEGVETPKVWNCPVNQYWIKDARYKFSALRNAGTVTPGNDKLPAKVTFDATNADVDLLYAEPVSRTGLASGNEPVEFTFNHLLSKVKFTVNNNSASAEDYSFEVNNITITCPKEGTIKLADKTWESLSEADAYSVSAITVNSTKASEECAKELLLIPGSVSINFAVDIKFNGTTIATQTPAEAYTTTIVGGHSYNFVINVAVGEEIKFSVDENASWTSGNAPSIQL